MKPVRGPSIDGVLVVDVDRLFISGPAVVESLHDNRPVRGRFDFALMRVRGLLPQARVAEHAPYYVRFMDEADDLHFVAASGTAGRIHFPYYGQYLGTEDLFQRFDVSFGQAIRGPICSKQPVGDDGMEMRMKPGVIPEGMDDHDHPEDAVIEAQQGSKEHLQALFGAVA
jgi:hypothetical protein